MYYDPFEFDKSRSIIVLTSFLNLVMAGSLHTLKKYVHIKSRPESSIVIGYIIDECLGFASMYFGEGIDTKRRRPDQNFDAASASTCEGFSIFAALRRSLSQHKLVRHEDDKWERAHQSVFFSCLEVKEYISGT